MKECTIFYAGLLYEEIDLQYLRFPSLPDGCYLFYRDRTPSSGSWFTWTRNNLCQLDLEDVPKELQMMVLIMG